MSFTYWQLKQVPPISSLREYSRRVSGGVEQWAILCILGPLVGKEQLIGLRSSLWFLQHMFYELAFDKTNWSKFQELGLEKSQIYCLYACFLATTKLNYSTIYIMFLSSVGKAAEMNPSILYWVLRVGVHSVPSTSVSVLIGCKCKLCMLRDCDINL